MKKSISRLWLVLLVLGFLALGSLAQTKMRILVVNDDGIQSPGLTALVVELAKLGEVVVCAPDGNRSGSSHASESLRKSISVERRELAGAVEAYAISGMPADAARFAIIRLGRERPFDVLVSGINRGSNVGKVAHLSGTVGAAMEGLYHGLPSLAVSQDARSTNYELAARFTAAFLMKLKEQGFRKDLLYSINVPADRADRIKGVKATPMGGAYFRVGDFQPDGSGGFRARMGINSQVPVGSDTEAYLQGFITITPLRFDWTDPKAVQEVSGWALQVP